MFCGGSDGSIFQVDLCTWVSGGRLGPGLEAWVGGTPGSASKGSGTVHRPSPSPGPGAPGTEVPRRPPGHWPLGPRSPGRERRASSQTRTVGRCSEATGAGSDGEHGTGPSCSGAGSHSRRLVLARGPRSQVTCLSVSTDGSVLLSGSHDETVRLWDVQSKQCIRTVTLKGGTGGRPRAWGRGRRARPEGSRVASSAAQPLGRRREAGLARGGGGALLDGRQSEERQEPGPPDLPPGPTGPVTNASIMLAPVSMLSSDFRPSLPLPHFNRHLLGAEHGDEQHRGGLTLRLGLHQQVRPAQGPQRGLCGVALRPSALVLAGGPPWRSSPLTAWLSPAWWPAADLRRHRNLSECRPLSRACCRPSAWGQRHRVSSLFTGQ